MECKEIRLVQGISSYLCNTKASGNQQATAEWMYMNNLISFNDRQLGMRAYLK